MEKLNVQLTKEHLFDFLLYHTFSKASGFLVNMLGMGVIVVGAVMQFMGRTDFTHFLLYVIAGVIYWVFNFIVEIVLTRIEKKLNYYHD